MKISEIVWKNFPVFGADVHSNNNDTRGKLVISVLPDIEAGYPLIDIHMID